MGMSFAYGPRDDESSQQTLRHALDLGITHFDTADMYGYGDNERLISSTIGDHRDEFVLATKFANRLENPTDPASRRFVDTSAAWVKQACDDSLRRLGFNHIDLYYMHRRNPATPIEETVSAMAELVQAGKVRWLGLSEVSPQTLRTAHAVHPISAVQMEYSLFSRDIEGEMLDTCRELGVAVVAYSPLGRGMLTGTIAADQAWGSDDFRGGQPRFTGDNLPVNVAMADAVRAIAAEIGATAGQAALAWLLAQGDDILPIPGTKRVTYLDENVAATELTLTQDQLDRLAAAVPPDRVAGDRYSPGGMRAVGH
jgi:aryl-alcohol dehydrogenase-like predicted oxidoreductase